MNTENTPNQKEIPRSLGTENQTKVNGLRPNFLIHLAISLTITYFILVVLEKWRPNSVAPFLNYHWLVWIAGILVLSALIIAGINRKTDLPQNIQRPIEK